MTIGEDRVRVRFNPSENSLVAQIKQRSAELIDLCEQMREQARAEILVGDERNRCAMLAQDSYEEAAMWAVKAATV